MILAGDSFSVEMVMSAISRYKGSRSLYSFSNVCVRSTFWRSGLCLLYRVRSISVDILQLKYTTKPRALKRVRFCGLRTPQITPDNRIILDLAVTQDTRSPEAGADEPAIDTQFIETQVLVNDRETVVLGGIYQQGKTQGTSRLPFLSDMPLLGNLFRNNSFSDEKFELIVFVTPKILNQSTIPKRN